jgi:hypothetical protein
MHSSLLHPLVLPILCGVVRTCSRPSRVRLTRLQAAHAVCHYRPPASIPTFISVLFLPPVVAAFVASSSPSLFDYLRALALYMLSLASSITLYRLSPFHPLAKYPGPVLARVSRFWAVREVARGHQHRVSHELFERYGDVVRTGPDHLIIRNASAIPVVLGAKNPWPKHTRESWLASHTTIIVTLH